MVKIPTQGKMDFDYSIGTEDRFSLRNWLEHLFRSINYNDPGAYEPMLAENLTVEGFTSEPLTHETYLMFLKNRVKRRPIRVMRFPELKIKFRQNRFHLTGTYEEFIEGILSYEGTILLNIVKAEDSYKLLVIKFFPRLMVNETLPVTQITNEKAKLQN